MPGKEIRIKAKNKGDFMGYLVLPPGGKGPGVVVIQEIFGVNAVMRGITDAFAKEGFVALCPDLFWRQQPGIQITDQTDAEWARAFELYKGFNLAKGISDLDATIETLRRMKECTGKVGAVGFCLGGRLAFLTATRTKADAAVGYYGVELTAHLKERVKAPTILHIAMADEYVPKAEQEKIHKALDGNPNVTLHDYEEKNHAFARVGGKHYDRVAADLANKRTIDFLKAKLR